MSAEFESRVEGLEQQILELEKRIMTTLEDHVAEGAQRPGPSGAPEPGTKPP